MSGREDTDHRQEEGTMRDGATTRTVTLALALLAAPAAAGAQLAELQPGLRVRVRAPGVAAGVVEGLIVLRSRDTILVAQKGAAPAPLPLAALTAVEVSRGKSRTAGAGVGALWGGGIMVVSGVVAAAASREGCDPASSEEFCTRWSEVPAATLGGVLFGAGIGALVGKERWERLELPKPVGMLAPGGRRVALGLRVTW